MFETETVFLLGLGLSPIVLLAAAIVWTRSPKREPLAWAGPKPTRPLRIPSAEETAESVRRFREAAERSEMMDFIWDRCSKGRALFLDDIRRAAGRRKKKEPNARVPKRL
jgi:hypothetical protein